MSSAPLVQNQELVLLSAINRGSGALGQALAQAPDLVHLRLSDNQGILCWIMRNHPKDSAQRQQMLDLAVSHGACVDGPPESTWPPLYSAIQQKSTKTLKWLLEHGANPNWGVDRRSPVPLEILVQDATSQWDDPKARKRCIEMANLLFSAGADPCLGAICGPTILSEFMGPLANCSSSPRDVNAFLDMFWKAGHPWEECWDEGLANGKWAGLGIRAKRVRALADRDQIDQETPGVGMRRLSRRI